MMDFTPWVARLPEVGDDVLTKARHLDNLRRQVRDLELELWSIVHANWNANEIMKARG